MVDWLSKQFRECMLFRRLYIVFMGGYIWMATHYSFKYLFLATDRGVTSIDIVANLAAIMAFPTVVMKGIYDKYSEQRSGE
jgi:hypothetical protein